jgi:hypothetical protein
MTLWVTRDGQEVTIHGNVGLDVKIEKSQVHNFTVSEHAAHLHHFWGELGRHLEEAGAEIRAQTATETAAGEAVPDGSAS